MQVNQRAVRRARIEIVLLVPLLIAVLVLYSHRSDILGTHTADKYSGWIQWGTVAILLVVGWTLARDVGRAAGPTMFRRMDPGTAGTVGFLIRLITLAITILIALSVAGVNTASLVAGSAFTAIVLGLAAQQTLGNLFAGPGAAHRPPVPGRRACPPAGGRARRDPRGDRQLARADVHDARARRGPDHDPQQRRDLGGRGPAPRARAGRRAGAAQRPGSDPATCRRSSTRRSRRRPGSLRMCCSRRSTATTSSSGSRRLPSTRNEGAQLADEVIAALAERHRRARGRARGLRGRR